MLSQSPGEQWDSVPGRVGGPTPSIQDLINTHTGFEQLWGQRVHFTVMDAGMGSTVDSKPGWPWCKQAS